MKTILLCVSVLGLGACESSEKCKTVACAGSPRAYEICSETSYSTYELDGTSYECSTDDTTDDTCANAVAMYCATGGLDGSAAGGFDAGTD